jgi:hypothetical protein
MSAQPVVSGGFDCRKSRAAHDLLLHQTNEQHVGFVEVVVASRCAGLLGLAAQLLIHAQALGENDSPFVRLVFNRLNLKTGATQQCGVLVDIDQGCGRHAIPQKLFVRG